MAFSNPYEEMVLRYVFGRRSFTVPPTYYAGLSSTPPNEDGLTGITEPSGGGYARVAIPNDEVNGFQFAAGQVTNGTQIAFPLSTGPWGEVTYVFFSDHPTSGTVGPRGSLSPAQTIDTNQRFFMDPGDLSLTLE
jgi:hypothetical protein